MREISKYRYLLAGFFTLVIFVTGALTSNMIDDYRSNKLQTELQEDLTEVESNQLQLTYLQSNNLSCDTMETGLKSMVRGYNDRLGKIQTFRDRSLIKSERFSNLRRRYIISGIRYWMFAQEMKEKCDYSPNTALFFTESLENETCEACARQGRQLSLLKKKYDGEFLVFSVPTTLDDGMVDILEDKYNVTDVPVTVVNGDAVLRGSKSRNEVETYFR
jgi:hypothetical protein